MTNNPARYGGLEGFGLQIVERVALDISRAARHGRGLHGRGRSQRRRAAAGARGRRAARRHRRRPLQQPRDAAAARRRAPAELVAAGVADADIDVTWVPGSFEIPVAAKWLAESDGRRGDLPRLRHPRRDRPLRARCRAGRGGHHARRARHRRARRVRRAHHRGPRSGAGRCSEAAGGHNVGEDAAVVAVEMAGIDLTEARLAAKLLVSPSEFAASAALRRLTCLATSRHDLRFRHAGDGLGGGGRGDDGGQPAGAAAHHVAVGAQHRRRPRRSTATTPTSRTSLGSNSPRC